MTDLTKETYFAACLPRLIDKARELGFEVTLGEAWRPPEMCEIYAKQGKGIKNSNHQHRLAIDLNLYKHGKWTTDPADYKLLGDWWKSQSTPDLEFCWGGDWGDCDHFSFEHNGIK